MRHLKTISLAAVAAMAVTVFVGVSSASALDILCENNTSTPCNAKVAVGAIIKAEATTPLFTDEANVHCDKSTLTLKVTKNDTTNGATGEVTGLTWTNCRTTGFGVFNTSCTVTTQNLSYHAEVTTPGGAANLTVKSGGSGSPGIDFVCGAIYSCTFLNTDLTLPIGSGNPASITANEAVLEEVAGNGSCPEETFWDAKYVAESPTGALFVRSS